MKANDADMDDDKDNIMSRITIKNEPDVVEQSVMKQEDMNTCFPIKYENTEHHTNEEHGDIGVTSSSIAGADNYTGIHTIMPEKMKVPKSDAATDQKHEILVTRLANIVPEKESAESLHKQNSLLRLPKGNKPNDIGDKPKDILHCDKSKYNDEKRSNTDEFKCPICDKRFPHVDHVVKINIHTCQTPHTSNVCGKSFPDNTDLTRHDQIHKQQFERKVCKKSLARWSNSMIHINS